MDSLPSLVRPRGPGGIVFLVIVSLCCCFVGVSGALSPVFAADQVTFSWRANPASDDVMGYRLYFGDASRFDESGLLKQNFSYAVYLDFTDFQRCMLTDSGPVCEPLTDAEVLCEGIYGETPSCTLYNLEGLYYFAMTAYNAQAESDYTGELSGYFSAPLIVNAGDAEDAGDSDELVDNSDPANVSDSEGLPLEEDLEESYPDDEIYDSELYPDDIIYDSDGVYLDESERTRQIMATLQSVYLLLKK